MTERKIYDPKNNKLKAMSPIQNELFIHCLKQGRIYTSLFEVIILINGGIWFRFWVVKFN